MFSSFDDIGRMDERAKFRTPGSDRVRDGRERMQQDDGDRIIEFHGALLLLRREFETAQRAGDEVI